MKRLVLISVAVFCAAFALVGHAQNYQDPLADPYLYVPGNDSALLSQWTNIMFDRIRGNDCTPPSAARNLMMLHVAGLDAAIASRRRFGSNVLASRVAVASAMRTVVSHLYQDTQASVDHVFHYLIQHLIPCQMLDDAIEVGYEAAMDLIARRLRDGSNRFYYYTPKNETCDYWSPTSGKPFWGVQFAVAKPYSMTQHAQFREADFPRAGSEAFAEDLHQVREYGAKTGSIRTEDESEIAVYWADGPTTFTPAGHWNAITLDVLSRSQFDNLTLLERSRVLALVNIAMFDASVSAWDMKLYYDRWRPVDAIRYGGSRCPGSGLVDDPEWESFVYTPDFPDYVSGHSTFSAAAASVLQNVLCSDNFTFSIPSEVDSTKSRTYSSFSEAANEASWSRILGGIHFESASAHGRAAGKNVGEYVVATEYTDVTANTDACNLHFNAPNFVVSFCPNPAEE